MNLQASAPPDPGRSAERATLDRALVRGVAYTGIYRWGTQVVSWAVTIVLARILTPSDYGVFGIATLYVGFIQLVNELGLGAAIVRRRDLSDEQVAAIGGVSVAAGAALFALSAGAAPGVAWFFRAPDARWPITLLSAVFVTTALKTVPRSLLLRDLAFRRVAILDATEALAGTFATLAFALLGFRYWALVLGTLTGGILGAMLAAMLRPHRVGWPARWEVISHSVAFGGHIMVSRISWYLYSNADFAVVGRRLGQALLGAYGYAWTIASIPVERVSGLVAQVTPSVFSAVQHDPPEIRRYLLRVTEGLSLITFPISMGAALVSDQFVTLLLGPRWWPTMLPLAILACYAGVRSVTTPFPHVLQAVGQSGRAMRINIFGIAVMVPLFIVGAGFGLGGVALAWVVGYPAITYPMWRGALEVSGLPAREYFAALRPAIYATLGMGLSVQAARLLTPEGLPLAVQFGIAVLTGVLTYGGIMLTVHRERAMHLLTLVRGEAR